MIPSALYSRILPYVPGCPEPTVDLAVMDAATEFAERSQIDFTIEAPVALQANVATYTVDPRTGLDVSMVREVYCGTRELIVVPSAAALRDKLPSWQTAASNEPTHYSCFGAPGTITVYPTPALVSTETLRIVASWLPGFGANVLPDELGHRYARDLAEGAKARLMLMPDRKWTNLPLAGVCQGKFDTAVNDARIRALHGKAAGSIYVRPRQFGRT